LVTQLYKEMRVPKDAGPRPRLWGGKRSQGQG
jgi:hypothetical protein